MVGFSALQSVLNNGPMPKIPVPCNMQCVISVMSQAPSRKEMVMYKLLVFHFWCTKYVSQKTTGHGKVHFRKGSLMYRNRRDRRVVLKIQQQPNTGAKRSTPILH